MKIKFKYKCYGSEKRHRLKSYDTSAPPEMCCMRMEDAWGGTIDLGLAGSPRPETICVVMMAVTDRLPGGERAVTSTPIRHCPWCGEPIVLVDRGLDLSVEPAVLRVPSDPASPINPT